MYEDYENDFLSDEEFFNEFCSDIGFNKDEYYDYLRVIHPEYEDWI